MAILLYTVYKDKSYHRQATKFMRECVESGEKNGKFINLINSWSAKQTHYITLSHSDKEERVKIQATD